MKTLIALLKLKPHGNNLCTPKAEVWLLLLRSSVLLIAGCEAAAWGYIGYLMAGGTHPWVAALLIGGAVGCLIAGLDAAFVMVDMSKLRQKPATDTPQRSTLLSTIASSLTQRFTKAHMGALVRLVMVAVSLTITAPFLAQLLFSQDIAARLQQSNNTAVAEARARLVQKYAGEQEMLLTELQRLEDERSREIAGRGLSRRYGDGPTARSLTAQIDTIKQQVAASELQETADLERFGTADPGTLAREYNVVLAADGIVTRFTALNEMKKIPGFQWTENAFRILLAGFFFGLLIFKWYEPRALEVYFDEELQGAYTDFLAGRYDQLLVDSRTTQEEQASPFAFAQWYYSSAKLREKSEAIKEKLAAITDRQNSFEAAAAQLSGDPGADMQELQRRRSEITAELEPLRVTLREKSVEAERLTNEIRQYESELAGARATLAAVSSMGDVDTILAKKNYWEDRLRQVKSSQLGQEKALEEAKRLHDSKQAELQDLEKAIAKVAEALSAMTDSIINARLKAIRDLGAVSSAD